MWFTYHYLIVFFHLLIYLMYGKAKLSDIVFPLTEYCGAFEVSYVQRFNSTLQINI